MYRPSVEKVGSAIVFWSFLPAGRSMTGNPSPPPRLNNQISPAAIAELERNSPLGRVLAGYHGSNHFTLVANGTCGNLNHLDTSWRWPQGTPIEPHRIATLLGAAIFRAYKDLAPLAAFVAEHERRFRIGAAQQVLSHLVRACR